MAVYFSLAINLFLWGLISFMIFLNVYEITHSREEALIKGEQIGKSIKLFFTVKEDK